MASTKNSSQKDVIYIDVDDEITAIIDKLRGSSSKIVALVLPKRATVMQSVVNMKLLKRTATEAKKNVVLITSEAALMPLAGIAGLHVAPSLQSRPEVPEVGAAPSDEPIDVDNVDVPVDKQKPVGQLAGLPFEKKDADDAIEVDNDDPEPSQAPGPTDGAEGAKKPFNKKLKVPDFDTFRVRLFLAGGVLLLLIIGWFVAFKVMPKATITIKTDTVSVNSELSLTGQTSAKDADAAKMIVPAQLKELKKTDSVKVASTGKKDVGTKASGTVTMSTQTNCTTPVGSVPAGTLVSANSLSFVTQSETTFKASGFQGGKCIFSSNPIAVTAQNAGDQYNLSARNYTVAGYADVSAAGSAMSGGTSKVLQIVSQEDVDGAKQKILDGMTQPANQEITKQLNDSDYMPLADSFAPGSPLVTASPNVGTEAAEVTVNVTITYAMHGVKKDALTSLLEGEINKKIDTSKQKILNNGLDKAVIRVTDKNATQVKFTIQTVASAGVQQDSDAIKKTIAGKKKGEVQDMILARPGVKDVTITYSPFWVYSTPSSAKKITIIFQQSDGSPSGQ